MSNAAVDPPSPPSVATLPSVPDCEAAVRLKVHGAPIRVGDDLTKQVKQVSSIDEMSSSIFVHMWSISAAKTCGVSQPQKHVNTEVLFGCTCIFGLTPDSAFRLATWRPPAPAPLLLLRYASYEPRPEGILREDLASSVAGGAIESSMSFSAIAEEVCTSTLSRSSPMLLLCHSLAITRSQHNILLIRMFGTIARGTQQYDSQRAKFRLVARHTVRLGCMWSDGRWPASMGTAPSSSH